MRQKLSHPPLPDKLGDVERVVGAAGARVDAEEELVEAGQHEGGGGGGAGGVQEASLAHQRCLQNLHVVVDMSKDRLANKRALLGEHYFIVLSAQPNGPKADSRGGITI